MKNQNEIKMFATTLPTYEVIMANPDDDPTVTPGGGGEEDFK